MLLEMILSLGFVFFFFFVDFFCFGVFFWFFSVDAGFGERKESAMLIFSGRKGGFQAGDAGRFHALRRRWGWVCWRLCFDFYLLF
jgi:hypothetical protein